jgi:hypothetical protein
METGVAEFAGVGDWIMTGPPTNLAVVDCTVRGGGRTGVLA